MLVIICTKYGKNPSRTVDATERTRFSKSRPNDLEHIGQGQRSLHVTHPLMLMMICAKYGNNRSTTENVAERTRFSKSRSNDLEDISQGQMSSHATHLLMLVIICTKYGKNPSRTVDATERTIQIKYGLPYCVTCPSMSTDPGSLNPGMRRSRIPGWWDPGIRTNTGAGDTVLAKHT